MQMKFTATAIARLPQACKGKQLVYWDQSLPGFGVLVSATAKSWVVQRGGMTRRTIERCDLLKLDDARDTALAWLRLMGRGIDPKAHQAEQDAKARATGITLQAALDNYLANRRAGTLRQTSKTLYRTLIELHLSDWLGRPCAAITPAMVLERFNKILAEARKAGRTGTSANCTIRCLRAVLNDARRSNEGLPPDPVMAVMSGRWLPERRRDRRIPDDKFEPFMAAVEALPNELHRVMVTLMLYTGMRFREVAALRWEEVDTGKRLIHLSAERTKARRAVSIPLGPTPWRKLAALRGLGQAASGFCFPSHSVAGHLTDLSDTFRHLSKAAGQKLSPHDLRRSFAVAAHDASVDMLDLKRLLNHSTAQDVTLSYVVPKLDRLIKAQAVIDRHLSKLCCGTNRRGRRAA